MNKLKPYIGPHPTDNTLTEYYLKSEADKYIDSLKDAQRWRKVSEEKPQDGQVVWAYDARQKLVIKLEYEVRESGERFIGFPIIHGFWPNITHWMPYNKPKAPEEALK